MTFFQAEDIAKTYHSGTDTLTVLKSINLAVEAGEMTAIMGESGSGKTTLLQILGTLDSPTSGQLYLNDEPLLKKNAADLARFRNKSIGFIFQFHHLLPDFTALENVMMPALIAGKSRKEMIQPATELLEQVELSDRTSHKINQLSGGEQQRAALARALIMNPSLLLADEPTGNLDSRTGNVIFELLRSLCRNRSLSIIMVTHNKTLAGQMDRSLTLRDGTIS